MVSMKDVAKLAGVSVSTVSRVVNKVNFPINEKTKESVEQAIVQLRYKPNLLAKSLRMRVDNTIGLVVPKIMYYFFSSLIGYVEDALVKRGYNLLLRNTDNDPKKEESFINNLISRNVSGIIFSRVSDESRVLEIIEKSNIPIIVVDRALNNEHTPSVILNNYKAGELAAEHLFGLGHRHFACITGQLNISLARNRLEGFRNYLMNRGIKKGNIFIFEGDFDLESGINAVKEMMESRVLCSAIWAQTDITALGVLKQLHYLQYKVPNDISVMGMDNAELTCMLLPEITTIEQPMREIALAAVNLIIKLIKKESIPKKTVVEPKLVVRSSTGLPPERVEVLQK